MDTFGAFVTTCREILKDQKHSMREVVRDLSVDALNWQPPVRSDSNSIAQMLSHALDAERFLVATAVEAHVERDREKHFNVAGVGANDLLTLIDHVEREVDDYLSRLTEELLGKDIERPGRTHTGAWWVLHAIEHSREHIGQALLTRQLWEEQRR